jgi:hypothetical protein
MGEDITGERQNISIFRTSKASMGSISTDKDLAKVLRKQLSDSVVLDASSDGYQDSLKRWSESAEREAVREGYTIEE